VKPHSIVINPIGQTENGRPFYLTLESKTGVQLNVTINVQEPDKKFKAILGPPKIKGNNYNGKGEYF
jgi:hypothetical protein